MEIYNSILAAWREIESSRYQEETYFRYIIDGIKLPDFEPEQFANLVNATTCSVKMPHLDFTEQAIHTALTIIVPFEGFEAFPYLDELASRPVWTVGYGSTHWNGAVVTSIYPKEVTTTQAIDQISLECEWVVEVIEKSVIVELNLNQFAALISFVYNEGAGAKGGKDGFVTLADGHPSTMLSLINESKFEEATKQFVDWDKSGGKILPGLKRRRLMEALLFSTPIKTVAPDV